MSRWFFFSLTATCLGFADAQCPNYCSGHGMCDTAGGSEQCLCYKGWMDADCSERECPFEVRLLEEREVTKLFFLYTACGRIDLILASPDFVFFKIAWTDEPDHDGEWHNYAECATRGICDRELGECVCFEGHTGKSCQRETCPNECSGHGTSKVSPSKPPGRRAAADSSCSKLQSQI